MPKPYVFVTPDGVQWAGLADDEKHAWTIALGWPDDDEIDDAQAGGCFVAKAVIHFTDPTDGYRKFINAATGNKPRDGAM